jgi:hypothetical protein
LTDDFAQSELRLGFLAVDTNVDMNSTSFGLEQQFFMGVKGYSDFLYSIIDNAFLFRLDSDGSGGIRSTSDFFDSLTTSVSVAMVFFTPDRGITTVMTVVADFTSPGIRRGHPVSGSGQPASAIGRYSASRHRHG